jgi:hypothetical protein
VPAVVKRAWNLIYDEHRPVLFQTLIEEYAAEHNIERWEAREAFEIALDFKAV